MMKPHDAKAEIRLLVDLATKVKSLNALAASGSGAMVLKCPCGVLILPSTPVISNLKDRQRGLLRSRIKRHLQTDHEISAARIGDFFFEAFIN
jgi:hypothetical protein